VIADALQVLRSSGSDQCALVVTFSDRTRPYVCWGQNDYGEVGFGAQSGDGELYSSAILVQALPSEAREMVHGADHACAIVSANVTATNRDEIWCYGNVNYLGAGLAGAAPAPEWQGAPVVWDFAGFAATQRRP
jgi:hypothetical protein